MRRFMKTTSTFAIAATLLLTAAACENMPWSKDKDKDEKKAKKMDEKPQAVATATLHASGAAATQPANKNVTGVITFTQTSDQIVHVTGTVSGLEPNTKHGFHIHEKGDLTAADLSSAGSHYNPTKAHHGAAPDGDDTNRHAGDLGNITADASGNATVKIKLRGVSLNGENSIAGRSIIVHAKEDDLKTDPSGNSGGRVAGGVIEITK
jgi:Cu-Zn family superoxide dismutase